MENKILCNECHEPLEIEVYEGLATYVKPCDCRYERERELAETAAEYTKQELEETFEDLITPCFEKVLLKNEDDLLDLKELDAVLLKIYNKKAITDFDPDVYDSLNWD